MTHPERLPPNEQVVALGGERPTWLWIRTCAHPRCDCRSAFVVASDAGAEALHEQAAAVRNALAAGASQSEVGAQLIDVDHFLLDIDSARVSWFNGRDEIDVRDHPRLAPIARRIDGEMLDEIGRLWHLGKGRSDPEQRVLNARKVVPRGWKRGDLLAWDELCAGVRRDLYDLGHHIYEAHELYCPVPECTCGEVVIDFEARSPRGAPHPGGVVVSSPDAVAKLEPSKLGQARLEQLWAAFQQRHPRYADRFAKRYATIKIIGARCVGSEDADTSPKATVGRNDGARAGR
ncbi:MAG: hypothetical protein ACREUT_02730 [Steroidobacteraceae bacterium]